MPKGIRVIGECEKEVQPDKVFILFGIEVLKDTVKDSTELANKRYNALLGGIKKLNLKGADLSTSEYTTSPYRVWEGKRQVLKGYKTNIGLRVEFSEIARAGEVIKSASEFGQENIQGPSPFVSSALYQATYRDCLRVASEDANQKAALLAKSLGVKRGKAFDVLENPNASPSQGPRPYMAMAKSAGGAQAAQIEYGKQKINLKLEVSYYAD